METFVKKVDKFSHQSPKSTNIETSPSSPEVSRDIGLTLEEACVPMPQPVARCAALPSVRDLMTAEVVNKAAAAAPPIPQQITPTHSANVAQLLLASPAEIAAAPKTGGVKLPGSENFEEKLRINLIKMRKVMQTQFDEVLQNIKQVKDRQLQVKDRLLKMKDRHLQMKDRQLQAWQSKFTAMHHNATLLAREVAKQDLMLTALKDSETKAQSLYITQKEVVNASIALANRDRKTKFVMAHTVTYAATAPTADVYDEVSAAARRQLELSRQGQMDEIANLAQKVEDLNRVYYPDRYNLPSPNNESKPKVVDDVENLPAAVPAEFFAVWMCQQGEVELTPEEEQKFAWFLAQQIRPPPVYSPTFKKPKVDWSKVNKWQIKNLPDPDYFAIHSAPQDPTYYTSKHPGFLKYDSIRGCVGRARSCGCVRCDPPFGTNRGLMTNHGVLSMPTEPVHGHVWNGNEWVFFAG